MQTVLQFNSMIGDLLLVQIAAHVVSHNLPSMIMSITLRNLSRLDKMLSNLSTIQHNSTRCLLHIMLFLISLTFCLWIRSQMG